MGVAYIKQYVKKVYYLAMFTCLLCLLPCSFFPPDVSVAIAEIIWPYMILFFIISISGVILGIYWKDSTFVSVAGFLFILSFYAMLRWEFWWGYKIGINW
jgi:hypothetical protein